MSVRKQLNSLLEQASDIAYKEVERLARNAMRRYPRCKSFCMAMGSASFYDAANNPIEDEHAAYKALDSFLGDYNSELKLTGMPMKIEGPDAPIEIDW